MERSTIFNGTNHYKWPFSIAMLVYQRVLYVCLSYAYLVGGLEPSIFMTCRSIGNGITIPTDELIFFRGVGTPPTIYNIMYIYILYIIVYTIYIYILCNIICRHTHIQIMFSNSYVEFQTKYAIKRYHESRPQAVWMQYVR